MKVFRRLLYGCIVGAWTAGGLAVLAYALYLLPVSLHMFHPVTSLAAWVYQHSLSRGGKIGVGLLVVSIFWPIALVVLEVVMFMGLAIASLVDALLDSGGKLGAERPSHVHGTFATDPDATAAYAAAHGFTAGATLIDPDRQSLFLSGDGANITPLLNGTVRGCDFTWYQTTDDIYAVRLGREFPHVYVRSQLNPDNRGLAAGHISNVTPVTLEGDFGRYFTAYASGDGAQIEVRELLAPDIMLALLMSTPTADFEFLGGTLFFSFPRPAASGEAAYAELTSLEPVVSQLLEQGAFSHNPLSTKFQPPRLHLDLGHLADKATFTSLKLIGVFFLLVVLGSAANNLPKVGSAVSMILIILAIVCLVLCALVTVGLLYAAVLYATFNSLRGLFIRAQVQRLVRAYRGTYSSAS